MRGYCDSKEFDGNATHCHDPMSGNMCVIVSVTIYAQKKILVHFFVYV